MILCPSWTETPQLLPLNRDVGGEQGEGEAAPNDGLDRAGNHFPASDACDRAHLEKDECNGEAAHHPLAMSLNFSREDKSKSDARRGHPQHGVDGSADAK